MLPLHGVGFWDSLTHLFPNTVRCNALGYHQFIMAYDKLSFVVCISTHMVTTFSLMSDDVYLLYKCVVLCYQLFWVITKELDINNCKIFIEVYLFKIYLSYMNSRCNYKNIFIVIGPFDGGSNLLCIYIYFKKMCFINFSFPYFCFYNF